MKRYFKGIPPHINIDKIEAEIAFLLGPPERALVIAKKKNHILREGNGTEGTRYV